MPKLWGRGWTRATPVYVEHLRAMAKALSREGSSESAMRKLALTCCHQSAGRSSEVAWITWRGIDWDPHFKCCFVEVPCSKPGRFKIVPFAAGRDRHVCFFTALGDYLALNTLSVYEDEEAAWFIERLQSTKSPGTTVSGFIADLRPDSDSKKYKDFLVPSLPHKATAGGFRPGACNALQTAAGDAGGDAGGEKYCNRKVLITASLRRPCWRVRVRVGASIAARRPFRAASFWIPPFISSSMRS